MPYLKRSIVPIFNFKFDQEDIEFTLSGNYDSSDYSITLKKFGPKSLTEINKVEDQDSNWDLPLKFGIEVLDTPQKSIHYNGFTALYFLIIDVQHQEPVLVPESIPDDQRHFFEEAPLSTQLIYITKGILQSLQLHCTNGISFEKIYSFHIPFQRMEHFQYDSDLLNIRILKLEEPSILKQNRFEKCKETFSELLIKRTIPKSTYKHFLFLALRYHQMTFNLEDFSHKFLILMIIFESLFKKENERSGNNATERISKFLSKVKSDKELIFNDFYVSTQSSFCKIRNTIAHGDPHLNMELIKSKYSLLFKYITKSIIKYINIPSEAINRDNDYYSEIDNYIDEYYDSLPLS